jgi:divalent metal cation (Fe/Co/Zn/Cd) transporter
LTPTPNGGTSDRLRKRGLQLVWATIVWNFFEVFITIGLGIAAGSIALIAFGTDSVVEVFASLVVVWHSRDLLVMEENARTRRSLMLIAVAFLALAITLAIGATVRLIEGTVPDESPLGIAYLAATALVMLSLAVMKQRAGRGLGSEPLQAEARITYLDAALASSVLLSLVLNAALDWWWADPAAALGVAFIAFREGREHWEEASEIEVGPEA